MTFQLNFWAYGTYGTFGLIELMELGLSAGMFGQFELHDTLGVPDMLEDNLCLH